MCEEPVVFSDKRILDEGEVRVWVSQMQYRCAISTLEQALEPMVEYNQDQLKMAHHAIGFMKEQINYALKLLALADKS